MKLFNDISNYNNVADFLPIINAVLCVETFTIFFALYMGPKSKYLEKWYKVYGLSAVLADVIIVIIGLILARIVYSFIFKSFSLLKFTGVAVIIQSIHDFLFYIFFSETPRGYNTMLDLFKSYSKEVGAYAILGDNVIIISSCILASHFSTYSVSFNVFSFLISLYFIPYLINK